MTEKRRVFFVCDGLSVRSLHCGWSSEDYNDQLDEGTKHGDTHWMSCNGGPEMDAL